MYAEYMETATAAQLGVQINDIEVVVDGSPFPNSPDPPIEQRPAFPLPT